VFSICSDSERKLLVQRLLDFEFHPLVTDTGLDLIQGKLVTVNDARSLMFTVDLASGIDKTTGIPDRYLGYLMDSQFLDINPTDRQLDDFFHRPEACCIEGENLDSFSVKLQSNISIVNKTEKHALTKQRLGQQAFRSKLLDRWGEKCALSGLSEPSLLRASHIKPWAKCNSDFERLDVSNGILLSANLDAAFDIGLISFNDEGVVLVSPQLSDDSRLKLLKNCADAISIRNESRIYLEYHRMKVFINEGENI
jgi:hypothetical protein